MMGAFDFLEQSDGVSKLIAALLLGMSVASWVVIFWKAWVIRRASADIAPSIAGFWQAADLSQGRESVAALDRERLILPLIETALSDPSGTLASAGDKAQQLTRLLRDALQGVLRRLQFGQVLLATVGSTAPFVGLLGTVWGIYHALVGLVGAGQVTIDQIAGPVGEALIMTAAGLAVAIPAVIAYNLLGRYIHRIEADLEGFAHDLRELLAHL
jgi:biopolymer transport protein ExbB